MRLAKLPLQTIGPAYPYHEPHQPPWPEMSTYLDVDFLDSTGSVTFSGVPRYLRVLAEGINNNYVGAPNVR